MRQILETEHHIAVPPMMYADPFYRITYLIKEQIRIHKWIEGEKGRQPLLGASQSRMDQSASEGVREVSPRYLIIPKFGPYGAVVRNWSESTESCWCRSDEAASASVRILIAFNSCSCCELGMDALDTCSELGPPGEEIARIAFVRIENFL